MQLRVDSFNAPNHPNFNLPENGNQIVLSRAPNAAGWIYREMGNLHESTRYNQISVEAARQARANEAESNALSNLVHDYTPAGEPAKVFDTMQRVESMFDRESWNRWRFFDIRHQAASADYWLTSRNLDRAGESARLLLSNARRYGFPKYIATAHRLLGEIAAVSGDANAAEEELTRSLEPFASNPAPLVEWRNHAALGRLLLNGGRRPAASREAFGRAARIVGQITDNIADPELRSIFLEEPAVRQVLSEGVSRWSG